MNIHHFKLKHMKKITIYFISLFVTYTCLSQTSLLDKALMNASNDIANKLKQQNKKKLVVLFITDANKTTTIPGNYFANSVSSNISNDHDLKVFERASLEGIDEAKELIKKGYIKAENTRQLGILLDVNAIIIGNYILLSNTIKLTLKALSTDNGITIASSLIDLPLNADTKMLLGIVSSPDENSDSQNPNCKEKNTGDYCFKNTKSKTLKVTYWGVKDQLYPRELVISSNETQCLYDIPCGSINYKIEEYLGENAIRTGVTFNEPPGYSKGGQFYVEQCKSKTFIIK